MTSHYMHFLTNRDLLYGIAFFCLSLLKYNINNQAKADTFLHILA
jgi:hypothetical protein